MKSMTGEIGSLYQNGEEVGGFKYWTAIFNRKTRETNVRASKYRFIKGVEQDKFTAKFYVDTNEDLKLVHEAECTIRLPEYEVGRTYNRLIEMRLGEYIWEAKLVK